MEKQEEHLSVIEAGCIVAGLGIGGGIMAVPYLASRNGLLPVIALMGAAFLLSVLLHLYIAEIVIRDGSDLQLVEIFGRYLFRGPRGGVLTWIFFALIVINFYALLAGYIAGAGEILVQLTGLPLRGSETLFYLAAASLVLFGLKAVGVGEKYAVGAIAVLIAVLCLSSAGRITAAPPWFSGSLRSHMALYGMMMFTLACFFSIPQAARGLSWNRKQIPRAVILGLGINLVFVLAMTVMAMLVSRPVTQVAIIGWSKAIGPWAFVLGTLFVLLAIVTSYWSVSYALAVILEERLKWTYRSSWLAATFPTLLLALSGLTGFLGFMRLAGGAIAVMLAVLVVPTLRACRHRTSDPEGAFSPGFWNGAAGQALIVLAYLAAAAGSMISLD